MSLPWSIGCLPGSIEGDVCVCGFKVLTIKCASNERSSITSSFSSQNLMISSTLIALVGLSLYVSAEQIQSANPACMFYNRYAGGSGLTAFASLQCRNSRLYRCGQQCGRRTSHHPRLQYRRSRESRLGSLFLHERKFDPRANQGVRRQGTRPWKFPPFFFS